MDVSVASRTMPLSSHSHGIVDHVLVGQDYTLRLELHLTEEEISKLMSLSPHVNRDLTAHLEALFARLTPIETVPWLEMHRKIVL